MISQTDLQGRLRLLRYGLIVLVVVTFLLSLLTPFVAVRPYADAAGQPIALTSFLNTALLYSIVVGAIAAIVYYAYQNVLQRTLH